MPDIDSVIKQVAMEGLPAGQTRIIVLLNKVNEKLDRILLLLEKG